VDPFTLAMSGAPTGLRVLAFSGAEGISEPFQYDVRVSVPRGGWDEWQDGWFEDHLGQDATLTLHWFDRVRYVHGIVTGFELLQVADRAAVYVVGLGSPLAPLALNRRLHVHQQKTTKDIVAAVLADNGVTKVEWKLDASYTPRDYCVQYRETDLDFVSRLLEEEGISYYFTHDQGGVTLVLTDAAATFRAIDDDPVLPLHAAAGMVHSVESVRFMSFEQRMRPKKVILGDYSFKKPAFDTRSTFTSPEHRGRHGLRPPGRVRGHDARRPPGARPGRRARRDAGRRQRGQRQPAHAPGAPVHAGGSGVHLPEPRVPRPARAA
jgi:type VI secretion system secreted protein VgrG